MDFIEFSRNEILILSNIIRLVRKETGLPLKMQSENFLKRLDTAITACKNQKTHRLYQEFIENFSQPDILAQLNITRHHSKTMYRGQPTDQGSSSETKTEDSTSSAAQTPEGKRKIIYRGQVKYVDK